MADAIEWYDQHAVDAARRYESIDPSELHAWLEGLIPKTAGTVADIGAGSGRDAAWFASRGYDVVAVEPSVGMQFEGQRRHHDPRIRWLSDKLPGLELLSNLGITFDIVFVNAVWQH